MTEHASSIKKVPQYAVREFDCAGCSAHVKKRGAPGRRYCSLPCYRASKRPQRETGKDVQCGWCKKCFYVTNSVLKDKNFCNKACHDAYQGRGKSVHSCKVCETEFRWSPSRMVHQNPKYCSIKCRNLCPDWKRDVLIAGNLKQQQAKAPNRLERAGMEILSGMGVEYQQQVLIAEKFTVDALLAERKIVIQWDGDYWHGYRVEGDTAPMDHRQLKRVRLDKSQDAYMQKCGYTVLRFWEHEVYGQPDIVRQAIAHAVGCDAELVG